MTADMIKAEVNCSNEVAKSVLNYLILLRIKSDYKLTVEDIWEAEKHYIVSNINHFETMSSEKEKTEGSSDSNDIIYLLLLLFLIAILV